MQGEFQELNIEPNVDEMLDRLFERIGVLYNGDYQAFFSQLKSNKDESDTVRFDSSLIERVQGIDESEQ